MGCQGPHVLSPPPAVPGAGGHEQQGWDFPAGPAAPTPKADAAAEHGTSSKGLSPGSLGHVNPNIEDLEGWPWVARQCSNERGLLGTGEGEFTPLRSTETGPAGTLGEVKSEGGW